MTEASHFAGGNTESPYCTFCAAPDGTLRSWEEVHGGLVHFLMEKQSLAREIAEKVAQEHLSRMPAWKDRAP